MMKFTRFVTPNGEELVVLPKADYEALVAAAEIKAEADEDADDLAIYLERKAALVAGKDEVLPVEISAGIMRGEPRIKAVRKWRGMTQNELADKAGITQGHLSDIESRKRGLTPPVAAQAAEALNVPVDWIA
jgi:DNA-binding XRE family transcriptional regulator